VSYTFDENGEHGHYSLERKDFNALSSAQKQHILNFLRSL